MSQSNDLSKLFDRFGGDPEGYREIVREEGASEARGRWPLLAAMQADRGVGAPPVRQTQLTRPEPAPVATSPFAAGPIVAAAEGLAAPVIPAQTLRFDTPAATPGAPAGPAVSVAPVAHATGTSPAAAMRPAPVAHTAASSPRPAELAARPAGTTPLADVVARLEGQADRPNAASERAPTRRSFLDRLKRS